MKLNKLCSNLDQSFTDEEKDTMRKNIGAAAISSLSQLQFATSSNSSFGTICLHRVLEG